MNQYPSLWCYASKFTHNFEFFVGVSRHVSYPTAILLTWTRLQWSAPGEKKTIDNKNQLRRWVERLCAWPRSEEWHGRPWWLPGKKHFTLVSRVHELLTLPIKQCWPSAIGCSFSHPICSDTQNVDYSDVCIRRYELHVHVSRAQQWPENEPPV